MDAITSAVPDTAGPPDAAPEHEVLAALRPLGEELAQWRYNKTPEGKVQRARIRAEIRPIVERGMRDFTKGALAEALGIGESGLNNIRNENPTGRWANFATGGSVGPELRRQLLGLGNLLADLRYVHDDRGKAMRAQLRAEIRDVVEAHPEATRNDMAKVLAISMQQLCNIMNEDPTGRNR